MATPALERVAGLLAGIGGHGSFAAHHTAGTDDLLIDVDGVGRIRFPVSSAQADGLCGVARPARYGHRERTLLDRTVRDTWEVPRSRVKIDHRSWNRTLRHVLERFRGDLGIPGGRGLKAELHSMLVYAPGQFFRPHRDSEKTDEMVGTLVVTLPSRFEGGALIVEHQDETRSYGSSSDELDFVAFYADCRHEVRRVTAGHRVVLTYNLMLGPEAADGESATDPATLEALARELREHFEAPRPPLYRGRDKPDRDPPDRCVYLLDHQYTERSLSWDRLKGDDAARGTALRAAADRTDCEVVLALADVHEVWGAYPDDPSYESGYRWERGEGGRWSVEDGWAADDPEDYDLDELHDRGVTLSHWIGPNDDQVEAVRTRIEVDEVCWTTPSVDFEPYAAEYEGYMGNWGNTMDRWYRRAAVVIWPRARASAVRAEASPSWAVRELKERIGAGRASDARELARSFLPQWRSVAGDDRRSDLLGDVLTVTEALEDAELAALLLGPFTVEDLVPRHGPAFVALVARYGEAWVESLLSAWRTTAPGRIGLRGEERHDWFAALPRLCEGMRAAGDVEAAGSAAWALLDDRWEWLMTALREASEGMPPRVRDAALVELAEPVLALLEATAVSDTDDVRDAAIWYLCHERNEALLGCLVSLLDTAKDSAPRETREAIGLDRIRRHCVERLEARLAEPVRREDDWSIALPGGCGCELCVKLGGFLASEQRRLEWPLAKPGRKHVHRRLDAHELPVRHETRRSGRPYTLVLTKTEALFENAAAERRTWEVDLDRLTREWGT